MGKSSIRGADCNGKRELHEAPTFGRRIECGDQKSPPPQVKTIQNDSLLISENNAQIDELELEALTELD